MTKRYRETLEQVEAGEGETTGGSSNAPTAFAWRGRRYRVTEVLGHWREDPGWWRRPDGQPIRIEQTDMWRVTAVNGSAESRGVYELVQRGGEWRLDRVWD